MSAVQHAHFVTALRVPHVNSSVRGPGQNVFGVWRKAAVDGNTLVVQVAGKRVEWVAIECVQQPHDASVGRQQNGLSVWAESKSGPFAMLFLGQFKSHEWPGVERTQVVQFDVFALDADGKEEAFRVEGADGLALDVHKPGAGGRPQIPQSDRVVQRTRHKSVVYRAHLQTDDFFGVACKVPDELVVVQAEISDRIVSLGRCVNDSRFRVGEPYQVYAVLLRVDQSFLRSGIGSSYRHGTVNGRK